MNVEIRRILVPIDLSDASAKVAAYAVELSRRLGAELTALYVVEESDGILGFSVATADAEESLQELENEAERELRAHASRYLSPGTQVKVCAGDPAAKVLETARELGADLIVMGNHGRSGLERMILGSTAEQVIRHADVPVVSVPLHDM